MKQLMLAVTTYGEFMVVIKVDDYGATEVLSRSYDLQECLKQGAVAFGQPIAVPMLAVNPYQTI